MHNTSTPASLYNISNKFDIHQSTTFCNVTSAKNYTNNRVVTYQYRHSGFVAWYLQAKQWLQVLYIMTFHQTG
ncbi:hypothetical protein NP493_848g02028 [Ridgeia piscesae]|uniref:Uncharacterized protein n=1 Tax=Ridgeia piscesae TaxID=27915 RepID=A0AAD9KLK4_RIDPI|nr:hypothetical protein NP493_848g02028 [Ridgeia piscesae]